MEGKKQKSLGNCITGPVPAWGAPQAETGCTIWIDNLPQPKILNCNENLAKKEKIAKNRAQKWGAARHSSSEHYTKK